MLLFDRGQCIDICLKNTNKYVRLATEDLIKDFAQVNCARIKPRIVTEETDCCIVIEENNLQSYDPIQEESFCVEKHNDKIFIKANGYLGTMWGIYTFSERILGVNPCYLFDDLDILQRERLEIENICIKEEPQKKGFRGVFINDEDLLTGWKDGGGVRRMDYPFYGITVAESVMDKVVETVLRLKLNLVIPASFLDIDNPPEKKLADSVAKRGIFLSQHHLEPLGLSHFTFENYCKKFQKEGTYSFMREPQLLEEAWRYYVRKWAEYDNVVWQVGLRGKADRPVWEEDTPTLSELKEYGAYISNAIQKQKEIVVSETKGKAKYFTSTLWMEGATLMQNGFLDLGEDTMIIFADNGPNQMFGKDYDSVPRSKGLKYGIYYHVQYYGMGPHLAPQTGVNKLHYNLKRAWQKGDNDYFILNISNVREFTFEIQAYSDMLWDMDGFSKEAYLERYCQTFGANALGMKDLIESYYENLPVLETKCLAKQDAKFFNYNYEEISPNVKNFIVKDGMVILWGEHIALRFYKPLSKEFLIDEIYEELVKKTPVWEGIVQRLQTLKEALPDRLKKHVECKWYLYAKSLYAMYAWYVSVYEAKRYYDNDETEEMLKSLQKACNALEEYLIERKNAEYGDFENWYRGDLKMNVPQRLASTKRLLGQTCNLV